MIDHAQNYVSKSSQSSQYVNCTQATEMFVTVKGHSGWHLGVLDYALDTWQSLGWTT